MTLFSVAVKRADDLERELKATKEVCQKYESMLGNQEDAAAVSEALKTSDPSEILRENQVSHTDFKETTPCVVWCSHFSATYREPILSSPKLPILKTKVN